MFKCKDTVLTCSDQIQIDCCANKGDFVCFVGKWRLELKDEVGGGRQNSPTWHKPVKLVLTGQIKVPETDHKLIETIYKDGLKR